MKKVYPHWLKMTERTSPLSHNHGARHAVCPGHAILNYSYALLESQCRLALSKLGFDVCLGMLHSDKLHRDSLIYDLQELFRPVVDDKVLQFIERNTLKRGDILPVTDGSCRLNPELARLVVASCKVSQSSVDEKALWLKSLLLQGE